MHKTLIKIGLALLLICVGVFWRASVMNAEAPNLTKEDLYEIALDEWLTKLGHCESRNREDIINPQDGGSPSYGLVQYKTDTFLRYNKRYNVFPDMDSSNVKEYIMKGENQRLITKEIIRNEPNAWKNWYNCHTKYGVPKPPVLE